jgi:hypothetical protein
MFGFLYRLFGDCQFGPIAPDTIEMKSKSISRMSELVETE